MGTTMRFWEEVGDVINHQAFQGNEEPSPDHDKDHKVRPQKYLRSWGIDYPYLKGINNHELRWLPVPEVSEVQRFIRNPFRNP
jgi:hypothetical protein